MKALRFIAILLAVAALRASDLAAQDVGVGPGSFLETLRQPGDESLLHVGSPFVDFENFDGGEQSSVTTTRAWRQILHELQGAAERRSQSSDQVPSRSQELSVRAVDRAALSVGTEHVPIALMNYTYKRLRDDAVERGLVTVAGERLIASGTESPFIEKRLFAAAALRERTAYGISTNFLLSSDLFYFSDEAAVPDYLEIDFDDGSGFQRVGIDDVVHVSYSTTGAKLIKIRAHFADEVLQSRFVFHVEAISPPQPTKTETISAELSYKDSIARGKVYYWQQDPDRLVDPVVVVEGLDMKEESEPSDWATYYTMLNECNLMETLRGIGHDIVFLDFENSQDYVQRNAFLLIRLIQQLREATQDSLVVVGPSLGGLVARYALAYMEYHGNPHSTRLYLSYDAPQQGGNIPLGLQHWVSFFGDEDKGDSELARSFGRVLDGPAARQMLVYHYLGYDGDGPPGPDPLRRELVAELARYGDYPRMMPRIAVTNGSGYGGPNVLPPGGKAVEWSDSRVVILYQELVEGHIWALPDSPTRAPVFSGQIAARIRLPFQSVYLRRESDQYYVENALPFDSAPGGTRTSFMDLADVDTDGRGDIVALHESHSYVPAVSALDIRIGDRPLVQPEVDLFYIIGGDRSNVKTPFDDIFFQSSNQKHISIHEATAAWVVGWIERGRSGRMVAECGQVQQFREVNPSSPDQGRDVIQVTLSEPQSGLASVEFVKLRNAYARVGPPIPSAPTYDEGDIRDLDGQTSVTVRGVKIDRDDDAVMEILVTDGQGRTRTCVPGHIEIVPRGMPSAFALEANYPNPFAMQTTIGFQVADAATVTLKVYDVLGREVAVLVDQEMQPGTYEAQWSAPGLPSGVYFYRMDAGTFRASGRMTLAR